MANVPPGPTDRQRRHRYPSRCLISAGFATDRMSTRGMKSNRGNKRLEKRKVRQTGLKESESEGKVLLE